MIRTGIVGGTGYTGVELLRILAAHPQAELAVITSRGEAGRPVADMFPSLRGAVDATFTAPDPAALAGCDVVFFATPHGAAMASAPAVLEAGARVVDLSPDFRLRDAALWSEWYGLEHSCPELLDEAVYGLPETQRERIREARLVANPGCYPTAVQLGLIPLLEAGVVDPSRLVADVKSGVSGAGRKESLATQFAETSDSFKAYGASGHRHLPEIVQQLELAASAEVGLTFVPHLTPLVRGIHATLYAELTDPGCDVQAIFEQRYAGEPFVDVMPAGSHPDTRSVRGSNMCRISWHRPAGGRTLVVLAAEDNLTKGASGQAVQNMNIMVGIDEGTGLATTGLVP